VQVRLALIVTVVMVVISGQASASSTPTSSTAGRCLKVPRGLVLNLRAGLKPNLRDRLGAPWGVKSRGQFGGLRGIREGPVYFAPASVRIATWAVDADAFRTGGDCTGRLSAISDDRRPAVGQAVNKNLHDCG
jgi:hypothetical protein